MGDDEDGSSAETGEDQRSGGGRRDDPRRNGHRGLFGRIIHAISPSDSTDAHAPAREGAAGDAAASPRPGMANLRRMRVDDVMVPKAEMVSVPLDIGRADLVRVFRESGVSRLPVYRGTLDSPVGLIHLKDLALKYGFDAKQGRFSLTPMLRPLLFVPPSMPLGALLQKMRAERTHMALVIDEYGGVDGLVTIEDVIEQVVGEIEDEHDTDEIAGFSAESPGVWLARATTPLSEFEAAIGRRLAAPGDEADIDTLGGLVFMLAGHVPARGEVVTHPDGHEFVVVEADPRRIKRLRVRLKQPEAAAG